jgi:hypothetical protein
VVFLAGPDHVDPNLIRVVGRVDDPEDALRSVPQLLRSSEEDGDQLVSFSMLAVWRV